MCSSTQTTHGGLLHRLPGGVCGHVHLQTGVPNPPVIPREVVVTASSLHPGGPQYRSRHPVKTGAEARGIEAPPRSGGVDMEGVRPGTSGSVCVLRDVSLSTLVLPHASSSPWTGRDGSDVAEALSVCISLDCSAPGCPGESLPRPGSTTFIAPRWPGRVWFPDIISLLDGPPPELPVRRDLLSRVGGSRVHPQPELWKLWAWPLRGPSS